MPHLDRRSLTKAAAWSAPVIVMATAAPAHATASGEESIDVGAFVLNGSCGIIGVQGPGFRLTASPTAALPVGTRVIIVGSGIANIGVFSISGGTASVATLSGTSRLITLTGPLPAGASLSMRTTLSISQAFTLNGTATLPEGYVGTGGKSAGTVSSTQVLCSAS